jgi:hypothetical protein
MLPTTDWKDMLTLLFRSCWHNTEWRSMSTLGLYLTYSPLSGKVCLHLVLILLTYHWVERYVFTSFQVWIMLLNADWNISKRHNSCVWTCSQTCLLKSRNYTRHEWCMMKKNKDITHKNKHISSFLTGKIQLCSFSFLWVITLQMASFPQSDKHAMVTYIWFCLRFLWC